MILSITIRISNLPIALLFFYGLYKIRFNKQSYSKINLTQLIPYSGDVSKVKVYFKTPGDVGGYKLLADSTLEAPEVLADPTIQFGRLKIGYIPIQQHIDYYWNSRQGENAGFYKGVD